MTKVLWADIIHAEKIANESANYANKTRPIINFYVFNLIGFLDYPV
jgi:hypothetical protein